MQPAKLSYKIYQGSTFQEAYRWESQTKVYVPIQSISKAAPCVITTTQAHNLPVGWRFRVTGAGGMKEINTSADSWHISTGFVSEAASLEQVWIDREAMWIDIRDQDAELVAPAIRPWANRDIVSAYTELLNYTIQSGEQARVGALISTANSAKQAYELWQSTLAAEARKIELNQVNSLQYTAYTSGGVIEYNEPVNLDILSARMQIRKAVSSPDVIYTATSDAGQIVLNNTYKTITITIPASVTAQFTFTSAVYSVELYDATGRVIPFLTGNLTLVQEITR